MEDSSRGILISLRGMDCNYLPDVKEPCMVFTHRINSRGMPEAFLEFNDAVREMLGYSEEELGRMSPADVLSFSELRRLPDMMERLLVKRYALYDTKAITRSGREIPIRVELHLYTVRGRATVLAISKAR